MLKKSEPHMDPPLQILQWICVSKRNQTQMCAKEKKTSKTLVMSTFEYIREKPTSKKLVMSIIAHIRLEMCDKSRTDS